MTITRRPSKAEEASTGSAPDASRPGPWNVKLRGKRQPLRFTLPPELVMRIDAVASEERRSRVKMIEIALEDFLQRREQQEAA